MSPLDIPEAHSVLVYAVAVGIAVGVAYVLLSMFARR